MEYRVKYEDNEGNDGVMTYVSKHEADNAIEEELELVKKEYENYDFGDFGAKTEIWESGGNRYASWERLWQ